MAWGAVEATCIAIYGDSGLVRGRAMYFVTTKTANMTVTGNLPLTAEEALAFIERAKGSDLVVEVRNELGNLVSEDELRTEVRGR